MTALYSTFGIKTKKEKRYIAMTDDVKNSCTSTCTTGEPLEGLTYEKLLQAREMLINTPCINSGFTFGEVQHAINTLPEEVKKNNRVEIIPLGVEGLQSALIAFESGQQKVQYVYSKYKKQWEKVCLTDHQQ